MNLVLQKNDRKARVLIIIFSVIVFLAVSVLSKFKLDVSLPFDKHLFAKINAGINSVVTLLLIAGLVTAKQRNYAAHRRIMLAAMVLSIFFLLSYIAHHLLAGEALFGDSDGNGIVSEAEKAVVGTSRTLYLILLGTHIVLAGIVLPFILFTAYRALINENAAHRRLAKITWPMWFYVALTGPIVYLLISPYYS
jgi:putative membrane protein